MKGTTVTILLMLVASLTVTTAIKMKKCQKLEAFTQKMKKIDEAWEANKCASIAEWSVCDMNGKMTKTYKLGVDDDQSCTVPPPEEMSCVVTEDPKQTKKGCSSVKTVNYTDCSATDGKMKITIALTCPAKTKSVDLMRPCQKVKDTSKLKFKRDLFRFKQHQLDLLCNKNCVYERAPCTEGITEIKLLLKTGDNDECDDTITKPCGIMKGNKAGGKQNRRKMKKKMTKKANKQAKKQANKQANKQAKKKARKQKRKQRKGQVCKYRQTEWSVCDSLTNIKRMVKTLKRGDPHTCDSTQVIEKLCKRKHKGLKGSICKYNRGIWSECDLTTGNQSMQKPLKPGNRPNCPPFKLIQRPCRGKSRKRADACKYRKNGRWGPCDVNNHTKARNMILVRGNQKICPFKKILTKPCRKRSKNNSKCKYDKSQWGPCNAASNTVTRTLTLKHGDPKLCNTTKIDVRKCKDKHLRPHVCKYRRTTWGECNPTTNMKQMIKTLKRGDPSLCAPKHIVEMKCKKNSNHKVCKYKVEAWSECDNTTDTITRIQVLDSGPSTCAPTKQISKKCKKRCVYSYGEWSSCDDSASPKRSRVQTLIAGGKHCDKRKTATKPCQKTNGEVRCFFGPWTDFEDCKNGVQKKRRPVLQGGVDCDMKSVKMKAC